ncbi:MAG: DUF11 domain-containing protein [Rudanella sp.]|nr:DUF11 domain-containing protein [Rudanella sp.]
MQFVFTARTRSVLGFRLFLLLVSQNVVAQLDATYPLNRMVFQRSNTNQATFQVAGSFITALDRVEVQVINRVTSATTVAWTTVQTNPANGQFVGNLTLLGGWYQLNFRGIRNSAVVGTDVIERVGVGEVYAILGHSNAQGSTCSTTMCSYNCNYCPTLDGAADDRVNSVRINENNSLPFVNPAFTLYEQTADNRYLFGLANFTKWDTWVGASPFAQMSWYWGKLGDQLVQQLGVPVLFYNAGFGGSNMEHVYKSAYDIPFAHGWIRYDLRMPYANMRNIMNLYVPSTGLRAVLFQHGINDRSNQTPDIKTHFLGVIDKMRIEFNLSDLAFIVAKDSYADGLFNNVRTAQDSVIYRGERAIPKFRDNIYKGPDLDEVERDNPAYSADDNWNNHALRWRPDGIHYSPSGQQAVANRWTTVLTQQSLLDSISPVLPQLQPLASIACPTSNTGLTVGFASGYAEYNWGDGTSNQSRTVGAGTYGVRLRATNGRIQFPPAITVSAYTAPAQPTVSAVGGIPDFCTVNSVTLSANTSPVRWNTNQTTQSISVTTTGTYSAQATDAVYGCVSAPGSLSVGVGQADLALSLAVDKRVLRVGDDVQYALTITNKGPCDPGSLSWQNRLPANIQFISTTDNLSVVNSILSSTLANGLTPNTSITQRFKVRVQQPGYYQNAAQIMSAGKADPNSIPGSGTGDGQDDASATDLRTVESSSTTYASPNPNQTALPGVQSNQPIADPQTADLSLQLLVSQRVVRIGQTVTFSLVVSNRGGGTASSVVVIQPLPAGLQFTSSASGMDLNNASARGIINSIPVGGSATLTFVATAMAAGVQSTAAQITYATPNDSDSIMANGYVNGEDDTAQVEVRVEN